MLQKERRRLKLRSKTKFIPIVVDLYTGSKYLKDCLFLLTPYKGKINCTMTGDTSKDERSHGNWGQYVLLIHRSAGNHMCGHEAGLFEVRYDGGSPSDPLPKPSVK